MRILIVKLSSLGDVVHAMPAVQDIRRALPQARIDWVVERSFAPLVERCEGVRRVVPCELRKWRRSPLSGETRRGWRELKQALQREPYDAVIDLQGLTKSALVARCARLAEGGRRYALANRTEGSSWEAPTRWVADVVVRIEPRIHAVARSRELCARALGYTLQGEERFGLVAAAPPAADGDEVAFVHGTSRVDKLWPEPHWIELGRRLLAEGFRIGLPHGSEIERDRAERLASAIGEGAQAWPRLDLGTLTDRLAAGAGVIGVDSGLSHIATALDRPHVQIYNVDTAWRTGPVDRPRQRSVFAEPTPTVEAVEAAWAQVRRA
ncbi:lipopolysaccharide heptosyltransferase I [Ramlibacter rhizophilus]|uniref:Lipopolysaccharide heptosyltransferase 1 n=1 Tax=Ramlibacter rhizophilus TaxID=1781167 RepID=A0A4Z0BDN3_9BURK|nr:lipopolysaccharide heptosyltransferase I [Ramlibacter rhizophilus]